MFQVYDVYKKHNASRLKKLKTKEQVNITGSLMKCYEAVPNQYFEKNFGFNFQYFTRDKEKLFQIQEDVVIIFLFSYFFSLGNIWIMLS